VLILEIFQTDQFGAAPRDGGEEWQRPRGWIPAPKGLQSCVDHAGRFTGLGIGKREVQRGEAVWRSSLCLHKSGRESSLQRSRGIQRRGRRKIIGYQEHQPLPEVRIGARLQQRSTERRIVTRQHG
jgi:hypothetical protein